MTVLDRIGATLAIAGLLSTGTAVPASAATPDARNYY